MADTTTIGDTQTGSPLNELIDPINRLLAVFGQDQLPPDTDATNLAARLEDAVNYCESSVVPPAAAKAMENRLHRKPSARVPTDAQIEARLRAKGIDPKHMPKFA